MNDRLQLHGVLLLVQLDGPICSLDVSNAAVVEVTAGHFELAERGLQMLDQGLDNLGHTSHLDVVNMLSDDKDQRAFAVHDLNLVVGVDRRKSEIHGAPAQLQVEATWGIFRARPWLVQVEDLTCRAEVSEARQLSQQGYASIREIEVHLSEWLAGLPCKILVAHALEKGIIDVERKQLPAHLRGCGTISRWPHREVVPL